MPKDSQIGLQGSFLGVLFFTLPLTACDQAIKQSEYEPHPAYSPTILRNQVDQPINYEIVWSYEGGEWDESGNTFTFQNDLGYTIELTDAYLGTISMELIPCSPLSTTTEEQRKTNREWTVHPYDPDESRLSSTHLESLAFSYLDQFGEGKASGENYCEIHLLSGSIRKTHEDGFLLDGKSAYLKGRFFLPEDQELSKPIAFEADVSLSGGSLRTLLAGTSPIESNDTIRIVNIRFPARSLDGVEIENLSEAELAFEFLKNLNLGTRVEVQVN